ncbi:hypothetical protein GLE_4734 [Lysobacter enzymogenes]|uniref:Uncharacterized protein n=2 Tax=Lysobacter TaxID=68 RepID=A0A0S2DMS0_LYSEN|nr:hypothetical protein GLE_4734 [Lysobacter enzymogenes]
MYAQCRKCKRPIAPNALRCPQCGIPMPLGGVPSVWQMWRANGTATRILFIGACMLITLLVLSMASDDVSDFIAQTSKAHNDAADSRELLLREQQRLNQPDGSERLDRPEPSAATALAPARDAKSLMQGMRIVLREVGDKSRYRQAKAQQRIEGLHLEQQLLPETLLGPKATQAARRTNREYAELLNYTLAVKQASQRELALRLRALTGEGPDGRAIMTEFQRNLARESEEDAALMKNRRAIIERIERIYDLADAHRDGIEVRDDGSLAFADPLVAEQYNRSIAEIGAFLQQSESIDVQRRARTQAALQEIDRLRR